MFTDAIGVIKNTEITPLNSDVKRLPLNSDENDDDRLSEAVSQC